MPDGTRRVGGYVGEACARAGDRPAAGHEWRPMEEHRRGHVVQREQHLTSIGFVVCRIDGHLWMVGFRRTDRSQLVRFLTVVITFASERMRIFGASKGGKDGSLPEETRNDHAEDEEQEGDGRDSGESSGGY